MSTSVLFCFPLRVSGLIVSGFTFRFLIHFDFIFGVRECSNFILLHIAVQFSQHHLLKRLPFLHCIVLPPLSGEGNGNPLQYSCLENPVDRGAWWAAIHGITQSQTQLKWLSMHACIGEGHGTHSSVLAWRIPGTEEPGGLPSMGSHRVGHNWSDLAAAASFVEE